MSLAVHTWMIFRRSLGTLRNLSSTLPISTRLKTALPIGTSTLLAIRATGQRSYLLILLQAIPARAQTANAVPAGAQTA